MKWGRECGSQGLFLSTAIQKPVPQPPSSHSSCSEPPLSLPLFSPGIPFSCVIRALIKTVTLRGWIPTVGPVSLSFFVSALILKAECSTETQNLQFSPHPSGIFDTEPEIQQHMKLTCDKICTKSDKRNAAATFKYLFSSFFFQFKVKKSKSKSQNIFQNRNAKFANPNHWEDCKNFQKKT